MKLSVPVFYLSGHSWPLIDWSIELPEPHRTNLIKENPADLEAVKKSNFKIAALPVLCTRPNNHSYKPEIDQVDLGEFDLVLLSDIEYFSIEEIKEWIKETGIRNYRLALGGLHPDEHVDGNTMLYRPWWAFNLLKFNQFQTPPYGERPYQFEMLLGCRRPHRDFAMLALQQQGLFERSIVTYRDVFVGGYTNHETEQYFRHFDNLPLQWPYISPNLDPTWETQQEVKSNNISPYMPWDIYRRTYYSIVAETLGTGKTFFLSEKTTKVLYGKRVFVIFTVPNFLQRLRKLGFKTFNGIIDESYDSVSDNVERFSMVAEQIKFLDKADPQEIYKQALPILNHNHEFLLGLQHDYITGMRRLLETAVPKNFILD
jgi:hypothetical protein